MSGNESRVILHDDYVEVILIGIPDAPVLSAIAEQAKDLVNEHGPMSVLINGQHGRTSRDARSLTSVMSMGRSSKLKKIFILTAHETADPDGVQGPSVLASIITTALGVRPIYVDSEEEARQRASE